MAYQDAEKTSTNYRIKLTKTNDKLDMAVIHDKEGEFDFNPDIDKKGLWQRLEEIKGVGEVDYNGHFGNYIFLTLDATCDEYDTWKKIQDCVNNFLQEK